MFITSFRILSGVGFTFLHACAVCDEHDLSAAMLYHRLDKGARARQRLMEKQTKGGPIGS